MAPGRFDEENRIGFSHWGSKAADSFLSIESVYVCVKVALPHKNNVQVASLADVCCPLNLSIPPPTVDRCR